MNEKGILCKHCHEYIEQRERSTGYVHISGKAQVGMTRCYLEPYGFLAEPEGAECSKSFSNPCNGALGYEARKPVTHG